MSRSVSVTALNVSLQKPRTSGLIGDSDYASLDTVLSSIVIFIAFCGMVTNCLNVRTFLSMRVKDGVTLSFLILSMADLTFATVQFIYGIFRFIMFLEYDNSFVSSVSHYIIILVGHFMGPSASLVCVTVAFIASLRCACVLRPLQFKSMFNKTRTGLFLGGSAVLFVGMFLPLLSGYHFVRIRDENASVTRFMIVQSDNSQHLQTAVWLFAQTIVPIVAQVIVIACVPVLVHALKAASTFRTNAQQQQTSGRKEEAGTTVSRLEGKDAQVVAQVVFISIVFVTCNATVIAYCVAARVETEFYYGKRYNNVHGVVQSLINVSLLTSGVINLFVYLKYNSSFREHFMVHVHRQC